MYVPSAFAQQDRDALHGLMRAHPLATLITTGAQGLCANHIPMLLRDDGTAHGSLHAHVARANPVWREAAAEVLVVFQGVEHYITPGWYASKPLTGRVVPTWNYTAVHARGTLVVRDDPQWLARQVAALSETHEATQPLPWSPSDAPADYTARLIPALVGIEIRIHSLSGKWKLSQDRQPQDHAGVVAGLQAVGSEAASTMAQWVEAHRRPAGDAP